MNKKIRLKDFDKVNRLYKQIKDLDKEILNIEKLADSMSRGNNANIVLDFSFVDLSKRKEFQESIFDEDGSLKNATPRRTYTFYASLIPSFNRFKEEAEKQEALRKSEGKFSFSINDTTSLRVLELLIREKITERQFLIDSIEKIGIEV